MPGQQLEGAVCLDLTVAAKADKLVLNFVAADEAVNWDRMVQNKHRFLKRNLTQNCMARIDLSLAVFDQNEAPRGRTAHKFSIALPSNLPPSIFIKSPHVRGVQGSVRYMIFATLEGS